MLNPLIVLVYVAFGLGVAYGVFQGARTIGNAIYHVVVERAVRPIVTAVTANSSTYHYCGGRQETERRAKQIARGYLMRTNGLEN